MEHENLDMNKVTLVYVSEDGTEYYQPVSDITSSGTLIDPETGDDMELIGVLYTR